MINILMTGAGAPGGPGIIKCLKDIPNSKLIVGDCDDQASGKFLNDSFVLLPKAKDVNFINKVLSICKEMEIDVIFPLVTMELFKFSKNRDVFEKNNIKIIVSDFHNLSIANNKSSLYKHLAKKGVSTPMFRVVNNYEEFYKAKEEIKAATSSYCLKPSISNGSRGVRLVNDEINEFDLLFNEKPNSLYISDKKITKILKENSFPELLIAEILPGNEYTIDTIVDNTGDPILILPRIRTKTNGGISIAGKFEKHTEIIDYCHKIIKSLKLIGPIGIQVKEDKYGEFKILEINPRIQGTSVAALGAGVNLPKLAVESFLGINSTVPEIKWDTEFIRYYNELFF
jgi:carbamoyl-phosphate synthase large subunit